MPGGKIRIHISEELYNALDKRVLEHNALFSNLPKAHITVEGYVESVMRMMVGITNKDPDHQW